MSETRVDPKTKEPVNSCFNPHCPACCEQRLHRPEEWNYHPLAGTGFSAGDGMVRK